MVNFPVFFGLVILKKKSGSHKKDYTFNNSWESGSGKKDTIAHRILTQKNAHWFAKSFRSTTLLSFKIVKMSSPELRKEILWNLGLCATCPITPMVWVNIETVFCSQELQTIVEAVF